MFPEIETILSDISSWIGDECLMVWFDRFDGVCVVKVKSMEFRFNTLEECLHRAWAYLDTHREER